MINLLNVLDFTITGYIVTSIMYCLVLVLYC